MSRAERRRAERDARKGVTRNPQRINLRNPVGHNFQVFITGNAAACRRWDGERHTNFQDCDPHVCHPMAERETAVGRTVAICGAGPSLRDTAEEYLPRADDVWGCNSAAVWLHDTGHPVTHAFTVDQTSAMCNEWESVPDVEYLLSSSVHPFLVRQLLEANRRTRFFHNYVGIDERPVELEIDGKKQVMEFELWLYHTLYPPSIFCGSGLNSVNRAVDLAEHMGYERIYVLGADCALRTHKPPPPGMTPGTAAHTEWLRDHVEMHADGGNALASGATPMTLSGVVDGRVWTSKPDMLISATYLVKQQRRMGSDRLVLVGDTLPNALRDKPDSFLRRLPILTDKDGRELLPDD